MGNLLKQGQDFAETFSSTASWDGIRWYASTACATDKEIYGLDAATGYCKPKSSLTFMVIFHLMENTVL